MRRITCFLLALSVALSVALVASTAAPAAAVSRANDPHDAPYPQDVRTVRLFPKFKGYVVVQVYSRTWRVGPRFNGLDVTLDTRGGPAADYRLGWSFKGDGDGYTTFRLYRTNGADTVAATSCRAIRAKGRNRIHATEIYIARSCLRPTKRVGVRVTTWNYTRYRHGRPVRGTTDNVPNRGFLR